LENLTTKKPRLAFVGVGWIGRARLQAAAESGLADIVLLSDPSPNCIEEALKLTPHSRYTTTFEAVINDPHVEGIVIATPSALHKEQAVAAFEMGKAVFCQKPLGRDGAEVAAVLEAAKNKNRLLGADFSYRHTAAFQKIHSIIKSGELGTLFAVDLKFHNAYGPDRPWFYDLSLSGGGCLLDLGIHLIDLMLYALDFPDVTNLSSQLLAKGTSVNGKSEVEDYAAVTLETASGAAVQLACSWNLAAGCNAVIEASFFGTKGGVALKNRNGSFYDFEGLRYWGTKTEIIAAPPDDWGGKALLYWIETLSQSNRYAPEAEQYLKSANVLDRIYGRNR
jgi:predicted dehydrogenase